MISSWNSTACGVRFTTSVLPWHSEHGKTPSENGGGATGYCAATGFVGVFAAAVVFATSACLAAPDAALPHRGPWSCTGWHAVAKSDAANTPIAISRADLIRIVYPDLRATARYRGSAPGNGGRTEWDYATRKTPRRCKERTSS